MSASKGSDFQFECEFIVNSALFDRLLLPGKSNKLFSFEKITVLSNLWLNRQTLLDQNVLHVSRETFIKDSKDLNIVDTETGQVLYTLAQHFFQCEITSKHLILVMLVQMFTVERQRLTRSQSIERLTVEPWPRKSYRKDSHLTVENESTGVKELEENEHLNFLKKIFHQFWNVIQSESLIPDPVWNHVLKIRNEKSRKSMLFADVIVAKDLSYHEVAEYVTSWLTVCNNGVISCIKTGKRLAWPLGNNNTKREQDKRAKMATDIHQHKNRKILVLNQLIDITLGKYSDTLKDGTVKLHRCSNSFLYLLSSLESITITKCKKVRIVTGPVANIVRIRDCSNLELYTTARVVLVDGTFDSRLYVNSEESVIIDGSSCDKITISPCCLNIKGLESTNYIFKEDSIILSAPCDKNKNDIARVDKEVQPFVIPFKHINEENLEVKEKDDKIMQEFENIFKEQDLSVEQKELADIMVHNLFQTWSKHHRATSELNGLESLLRKS